MAVAGPLGVAGPMGAAALHAAARSAAEIFRERTKMTSRPGAPGVSQARILPSVR